MRKGKLSESLNIEGPAAGRNEFRIFRIAFDSSNFGSKSMTVTIFQTFE